MNKHKYTLWINDNTLKSMNNLIITYFVLLENHPHLSRRFRGYATLIQLKRLIYLPLFHRGTIGSVTIIHDYGTVGDGFNQSFRLLLLSGNECR